MQIIFVTILMAFSMNVFAKDDIHLDNTFFSLDFNKEFRAEPCETKGAFALPPPNGYCIEPMKLVTTDGNGATGNARVKFAYGELPYWTGGQFVIELINGKLEGISMGTAGFASRSVIIEALTRKFGDPNVINPMPLQNAFGARYDGSILQWGDSKLTVTYTPIFGDLKQGSLTIFTPIGGEAFNKRMKEILKNVAPNRAM